MTAPPTLMASTVPGQSTATGAKERHPHELDHLVRDDPLLRQADERQIDVGSEQRAEQRQHDDEGVEAERRIGLPQQPDLNENDEADQNGGEYRHKRGADRKIMDMFHGAFIRPRRVQTRAKAAMIRSACGRRASAF